MLLANDVNFSNRSLRNHFSSLDNRFSSNKLTFGKLSKLNKIVVFQN